jgi:hypothetical protein
MARRIWCRWKAYFQKVCAIRGWQNQDRCNTAFSSSLPHQPENPLDLPIPTPRPLKVPPIGRFKSARWPYNLSSENFYTNWRLFNAYKRLLILYKLRPWTFSVCIIYNVVTVLHPGKGECADPVNEDAILERVGGRPPGRNRERQLASDTGDGKTWISVKWRDDKKIRKTTPSRLRVTTMHRVSWCA